MGVTVRVRRHVKNAGMIEYGDFRLSPRHPCIFSIICTKYTSVSCFPEAFFFRTRPWGLDCVSTMHRTI